MADADTARGRLLAAARAHYGATGRLDATLDHLRLQAGVSVGALYHHFPDRRALVTALYVEALSAYQEGVLAVLRADVTAEAGVRGVVRHHLDWVAGHRDLGRLLLEQRGAVDEEAVVAASRPFLAEAMRWYRQHAHYEALRPLSFDLAYALWLGPSQEYLRHWLATGVRRVPTPDADALADAAWNTLRSPDERL